MSWVTWKAVEAAVALESVTLSEGEAGLITELRNPRAETGTALISDYFGISTDISDNYVVVGSYREDVDGDNNGIAYVYNATTGDLVSELRNPRAAGGTRDYFGYAVGISGNLAVVGAYQEDVDGTVNGIAYVFNATTGSQISELRNPRPDNTYDYFGECVAIYGNLAVVGSRTEDIDGVNEGIAYVFNATTGSLITELRNPRAADYTKDLFGAAVAIDGNYAVVGAYDESIDGSDNGIAYVFNATTGSLISELRNPRGVGGTNDNFGRAVAINGNYVVVGSQGEDLDGSYNGIAYAYNATTGSLISEMRNPRPDSIADSFGRSVAISGNYVVVGAPGEDIDNSNGIAYVFDVTTGSLITELRYPRTENTSANYGSSVAIDGNNAAVGAPQDDTDGERNGMVFVFGVGIEAITHICDQE